MGSGLLADCDRPCNIGREGGGELTGSVARVRLIGLPTDSHSSFLRGAAAAPPLIRAALWSEHGNAATESGLELGGEIDVDDASDLALDETDQDLGRIADTARS